MEPLPNGSEALTDTIILTRRHQLTAGAVTLFCLLLMAGYWTWEYQRRGRLINVDRPNTVARIDLKVDLNQADWPELTLLPEISETMARRVVEFRELNGRFQSLNEVQQVKGIGPRTFARIKPFLSSIPPVSATAGRE